MPYFLSEGKILIFVVNLLRVFLNDLFITILLAPPKWILTPDDVVTILGSSISAVCKASGSPEPRIKWRKISGKF